MNGKVFISEKRSTLTLPLIRFTYTQPFRMFRFRLVKRNECKKLYECGFINYWKQVKLCYILRTVDPFVQGYEGYIRSLPGHLLGVKSEWMESEMNDTSSGENASTGYVCKPRLHITNTKAIGNLNNDNDMVVYTVNEIADVELRVCTGGRFEHLAECKIYQKYRDECTKHKNYNSNQISCYVLFWKPDVNGKVQQRGQRRLNKVLAVDIGGQRGKWHEPEFCKTGKFAFAYTLEINSPGGVFYDDTSLNGVIVHCGSFNELDMRRVDNVTSGRNTWGDQKIHVKCPERDGETFFLVAFLLKVEAEQGSRGDTTAANYVRFRCRDFLGNKDAIDATTETHGEWGDYGKWSDNCPPCRPCVVSELGSRLIKAKPRMIQR